MTSNKDSTTFENISSDEADLIRDQKPISVEKPKLYIKLAGSAYPIGRLSDATYSNLEKHDKANSPLIELAHGNILLGRGFNMVLGKGSSGKTTYLKALAKTTGWELHKFFEPDPDSATSLDELCELLHSFVNSEWEEARQGIIIDSIKAIVYSKGNLGKYGINRSVMQELSNLSAVAAKSGKIIVGAVNLASDEDELYREFGEAAKSSINGLIDLLPNYTARYRIRDYMSGERHDFSNSWTNFDKPSNRVGPSDVDSYSSSANDYLDKALNQATRPLGRVHDLLG